MNVSNVYHWNRMYCVKRIYKKRTEKKYEIKSLITQDEDPFTKLDKCMTNLQKYRRDAI